MPLEVSDNVIRFKIGDSINECIAQAKALGASSEVFIDSASGTRDEVIAAAKAIFTALVADRKRLEPVVIGALPVDDSAIRELAAPLFIRTTSKSFDTYCRELGSSVDELFQAAKVSANRRNSMSDEERMAVREQVSLRNADYSREATNQRGSGATDRLDQERKNPKRGRE